MSGTVTHFLPDGAPRLDRFLADSYPEFARSRWDAWVRAGNVRVNGEVVQKAGTRIRAGATVETELPDPAPPAMHLQPEDIALPTLFEDSHLWIVDKPAGMVVHPAPGHAKGTLVNALLARIGDLRGIGGELRPGIVHRIDKDTSGLLVVAKDDVTMVALGAAFKAHDIARVYEALVVGKPPAPSGRVETLYGRDPRDRKKFSIKVKAGKRAITNWRVIETLGDAARIEARLETGRTHQVRVHMAALGLPLLGDPVYGRTPREPALRDIARTLGRQALHARSLGFRHPKTGARLELTSEPPADYARALASLRALGAGGIKPHA